MIEPVGYRVLVELADSKKVATLYTDGSHLDDAGNLVSRHGIVLKTADDMKEELKREQIGMETGVVVALGPIAYHDYPGDPWVAVGDTVFFQRYEGEHKEIDGKHYRVLNDVDIFARAMD